MFSRAHLIDFWMGVAIVVVFILTKFLWITPPDLGLCLHSLEADTVCIGCMEGCGGDSTMGLAEGCVRLQLCLLV